MKTCATRARLLIFVIATMLVAACGQKGPLYIPQPAQEQVEQHDSEKEKRDKQEEKQDKD